MATFLLALRKTLPWLPLVAFISSCELPEKPYPAPLGVTTEAPMGSTYENVVYFSFESDTALLIRKRDAFDLVYNPTLHATGLRLNTSGFGQFKRSNTYDFHAPLDTSLFPGTWQWSREGEHLFQEDLGRWTSWESAQKSPIFAVKPGINSQNQPRQMWRIQLKHTPSGIQILYAPFDRPDQKDSIVWSATGGPKWLHFDRGEILPTTVEPAHWDWSMGQYVDQDTVPETGEIIPYIVRGVLLPPGQGAHRTRQPWKTLAPEWAYAQPLVRATNAVGYNWKSFSFATSSYLTDTSAVFLIDRPDHQRYALRFLDFYNQQGIRGYIQCQWKLL